MSAVGAFILGVSLVVGGKTQELKSWSSPADLATLKSATSREKDPATGEVVAWQGVLVSEVLEQAMAPLTPEQKSQFDLIIFTGSSGAQAFVPRSVVTKYPLMLARKRANRDLAGLQVVLPWTSKPKVLNEEYLPLEDYFVPDLKRIELASYRERYAHVMLKRRTDPSAIRGEKIVMQNCLGCHSGAEPHSMTITQLSGGSARARALASADGSEGTNGHKMLPGVKKFSPRDQRAITSFLDSYHAENPAKN